MFRTPFTDFMSPTQEAEAVKKCAKFSMQKALCMEAYGAHRAPKMCADEIEDYHECIYGWKQRRRVQLMQEEREKQIKSGERKEKYSEPPPMDTLYGRGPHD
ncbi:NADH dehydrogenase (ubiquinone) 15 kDa subunit [Haemaphysalis longicornis]